MLSKCFEKMLSIGIAQKCLRFSIQIYFMLPNEKYFLLITHAHAPCSLIKNV